MATLLQKITARLRGGLAESSKPIPAGETMAPVVNTSAAYMRGNGGPVMTQWRPALRDTQDDVQMAWTDATARATDMIQNSGWIAGGVNTAVGAILGAGLRLVARPDTTVINFAGLTDDAGQPIDAEGWARFVERRWEDWSENPLECDAVARQTTNEQAIAALKTWFATGEIVTLLPFYKDDLAISGTKVLLLPSWKLSQKNDMLNRTKQGVQMDSRGRPYAYIFRMRDFSGMEKDVSILARDAANRPQVTHLYQALPGQIRGITVMAPALQVVKQYDQLANATLTAALIQALFAATIESEAPTADVMNALQTDGEKNGLDGGNLEDYLKARMGWASNTTIDLGDQSKIAHLFPGENLKFNKSEHPNTVYEAFVKTLLREVAKALGITVEQLTGDYIGVSYTGVRMSTTDNWQLVLQRRKMMARWYKTIYETWLEEEIETGRIKFPGGLAGFLKNRPAATRSGWRGPAKPQADELKTAKMHEVYRQMGVMSDTDIADDLGTLISDVYESRSREAGLRKKNNLPDVGPSMQLEAAKVAAEADDAQVIDDEGKVNV